MLLTLANIQDGLRDENCSTLIIPLSTRWLSVGGLVHLSMVGWWVMRMLHWGIFEMVVLV